jgi:hypothetical protein
LNDKPLSIPLDRLVLALDYVEFLDRSWTQIRRHEWGFAQVAGEQNPHGFAADRARAILLRFNLRWVPPMSQAFFAPKLHEVLRSAAAQKVNFQVPCDKLIEDLADATCMCTTPPAVLAKEECNPGNYSYRRALRDFFTAFACGEIVMQDLRPHLSI